jgi:MFS family permease
MAAYAYIQYALGFITPYLRDDLRVPESVAVLPNSIAALGLVGGGFIAGEVAARIGPQTAARLWIAVMGAAGVTLAARISLPVVLVAAGAFGVATAGVLTHVNSALGGGGGHGADTRLVRANLWAVAGAFVAPLVLAWAAEPGSVGWAAGLIVPVPVLALIAVILPPSPARDVAHHETDPGRGRLPTPFWFAWLFIFVTVGTEFSFVVWGTSVVSARTGLDVADATRLGSLFVGGMIAGRLLLSTGVGSGRRSLTLLRLCIGLAAIGAALTWVGSSQVVAGAGLFLGGMGVSAFYPLGVGLALARAPSLPVSASARLTLASGSAIFAAPLVLGVVAQMVGVVTGWSLVLGLLAAGFCILTRLSAVDGPEAGIAAPPAAGAPPPRD